MSNALALSAILGISVAVWVLYLYRKGKLRENYALFWLFISFTITILSTFGTPITWANMIVQAANPTDVVLSSFIFLLILVCIYHSMKISELTEQNKKLAQALALLEVYKREKAKKENRSYVDTW